jgi:hypothetical protein
MVPMAFRKISLSLLILVIVFVAVLGLGFRPWLKPKNSASEDLISQDLTENWPLYFYDDLQLCLKAPTQPRRATQVKADFKPGEINLSSEFKFDFKKYQLCRYTQENEICIIPGTEQGQSEDLQPISLAGVSGTSVFLRLPNEQIVAQVIQVSQPNLEISFKIEGDESKELFQRILSTIQFLDINKETANWKKYKNEEFKFRFKYPESATLDVIKEEDNVLELRINRFLVEEMLENETYITAKKNYAEEEASLFLGKKSDGKIEVNHYFWRTYTLMTGEEILGMWHLYTYPIYAVQREENGILYTVKAYWQTGFSLPQQKILASFRFYPQPISE